MRHLIIGNSAAGVFAAEAIRRTHPADTITMMTEEDVPAYSRCLTSYLIAGRVREEDMMIRPADFYQSQDIEVIYGSRVEAVDTRAARVTCAGGGTIPYDRLLVASGARPVMPGLAVSGAKGVLGRAAGLFKKSHHSDIFGMEIKGVQGLRSLKDARAISGRAVAGAQAVVLGGGLVSLKTALGLLERGLRVTVVVSSARILSQAVDEQAAGLLQRHLERHGMRFIQQSDVTEITSSAGEVTGVVLTDGTRLPASLVVVGKGVKSNTEFLRGTPVAVNRGVLVNQYLESSVPGVYAAGDVAEASDLLRRVPAINAIWPNATAQGELAGYNMAGERRIYRGSISMNSMNFFGLSAINAGLSQGEGDEYEVRAWSDASRNRYRKLVFRGDFLVGFTLVGDIRRAGLLTSLVMGQVPLDGRRERLIRSGKI